MSRAAVNIRISGINVSAKNAVAIFKVVMRWGGKQWVAPSNLSCTLTEHTLFTTSSELASHIKNSRELSSLIRHYKSPMLQVEGRRYRTIWMRYQRVDCRQIEQYLTLNKGQPRSPVIIYASLRNTKPAPPFKALMLQLLSDKGPNLYSLGNSAPAKGGGVPSGDGASGFEQVFLWWGGYASEQLFGSPTRS